MTPIQANQGEDTVPCSNCEQEAPDPGVDGVEEAPCRDCIIEWLGDNAS